MSHTDLEKEVLTHDPMVDTYAHVAQFFQTHRNLLTGILASIVVVILGVVGFDFYAKSQEEKAARLMSFAEASFNAGDYEKALKGNEEELTPGFEKISGDYSSTNAGNLSLYYAAICESNLGNAETALSYMNSFDVPEGVLGLTAIGFHANLLLDAGKTAEAAERFEKAANWVKSEVTVPFYLAKAAQAYLNAGNKDRAKKLTNRILDEYPAATEVAAAQKIAGML